MIFNHRPANFRDFKLSERFLDNYRNRQPKWGFGGLSYFVFKRTYPRDLPDGTSEEFWQTIQRVVEGTYNVQKLRCAHLNLPWSNSKAQRSAQIMYDLMWNFKFLPPGRGLRNMGCQHIYSRGAAYLNNCGFVSTEDIKVDYSAPFCWSMDMSMLGVGVGFDTRGAGTVTIQRPKLTDEVFVVPDSRQGWVNVLKIILDAYIGIGSIPQFDYSEIRDKGEPLKTIGGKASGPQPLIDMVENIINLYNSYIDKKVDSVLIVDTFNYSGKCVVSGGIRRTAQIAFGNPDDESFLDLKLDEEALNDRRWCSNNSVFSDIGLDYYDISQRTQINGEPGYMWLENARAYSRMIDPPDNKDYRIAGANPCIEQSLESFELCCLCETFPAHHDSIEDYKRTLKYAYLYAKTVTLIPTHDQRTNAIQMRNRRIGLSHSGIQQAIKKFGRRAYLDMCNDSYHYIKDLDKIYSEWLCVPRSIKMTSVKPSGTVSLLAGATPGIHFPISKYYIRRVRISDTSPYVKHARNAGYKIEDDIQAPNTKVIEFPVKCDLVERGEGDVTIWEQVKNAVDLQKYWADNQVSCTIKFQPHEASDIPRVLEAFETELKSISFLPLSDHGYEQAPYEAITRDQYLSMTANIKPLSTLNETAHDMEDKFCDGEACMLPQYN